MGETTLLTWVIGIVGSVCAIIFGISTYLRNRRIDDTSDGKRGGSLMAHIENIEKGIDEIKEHQRRLDEQYLQMLIKVSQLEANLQHEHERITQMCQNPKGEIKA